MASRLNIDTAANAMDESSYASLTSRVRNGDPAALTELCQLFAPLVHATARRYPGHREDWDDLIQHGFLCLIQAIREYDVNRGVYFAHYLKLKVRQGVLSYVRVLEAKGQGRSGLQPLAGKEGDVATDDWSWLADPSALSPFAWAEWTDLISRLSQREQMAIYFTVFMRWTTTELATSTGVSVETVKTWRKRALKKLRQSFVE